MTIFCTPPVRYLKIEIVADGQRKKSGKLTWSTSWTDRHSDCTIE